MSEEIRAPLCSRPDCTEVAEWEVAGPVPVLLCEQHADERFAQNMDERWEQFGPERYVTYVAEVLDGVWQLEHGNNPVAEEVGARVAAFLEDELGRARLAARLAAGLPPD
jgi:hypothetical protein